MKKRLLQEANAISEFFCHAIYTDYPDTIRFAFSFNGKNIRVIFKGREDSVLRLLNCYYHKI